MSKSATSFKLRYQLVLIVDTQEKGSDTLNLSWKRISYTLGICFTFFQRAMIFSKVFAEGKKVKKVNEKVTGGFCLMKKSLDFYLIVSFLTICAIEISVKDCSCTIHRARNHYLVNKITTVIGINFKTSTLFRNFYSSSYASDLLTL